MESWLPNMPAIAIPDLPQETHSYLSEMRGSRQATNVKPAITKKTVSKQACLSCRTHHLRCEGVAPCKQCIKRDAADQCVFPVPKKRGPKSKELKEQVAMLQTELERQKAIIRQYEELLREKGTSSGVMSPRSSPDDLAGMVEITPSQMVMQASLVSGTALQSYLEHFQRYVHPHLPVVGEATFQRISLVDLHKLTAEQPMGSSTQLRVAALQLNAALALGARTAGQQAHADMFMGRARQAVGDLFDSNSRKLASSLCMMAYYACGSGEGSKGTHYTALALQICKNLRDTSTAVYRKCMITKALAEEGCHERHNMLVLADQEQQDVTMSEVVFATFIRVLNDITLSLQVPDYEALLRRTEEVQAALDRHSAAAAAAAGGYSNQSHAQSLYLVDSLLLCAARALLYDQIGLASLAQQWADSTSNIVDQCDGRSLFLGVVMAIVMVARVHWQANRMEMVQQDLNCLKRLSAIFPLAGLLHAKMSHEYGAAHAQLPAATSQFPEEPRHMTAIMKSNVSDAMISALGASKCNLPDHLVQERRERQAAAKAKAQAWALGLSEQLEEPYMDPLQAQGDANQPFFSLEDAFLKNINVAELFPEIQSDSI